MKRSLRTLAERDFRDPFRSRSAWPTLVLFAAVFGLFVYAMGPSPGPSRPEFGQLLVAIVYFLVPLAALQFGYDRLSGPRQTGEVRLLLAPPHSRRDLLLGTALGRSAFTGSTRRMPRPLRSGRKPTTDDINHATMTGRLPNV